MPQEMLAEDKHWSRWYLFSSYLIPHTLGKHAFTHTLTNTNTIHESMQLFMDLRSSGLKKRTVLLKLGLHLKLWTQVISACKCKTGHFHRATTNTHAQIHNHTGSWVHFGSRDETFLLCQRSSQSSNLSLLFLLTDWTAFDQKNNPDQIACKLLPRTDGTASWKTILLFPQKLKISIPRLLEPRNLFCFRE